MTLVTRSSSLPRRFAVVALAVTAACLPLYVVHGLFDSPYWKNDLSVEFWLMAALLVVAVRATRTPADGTDRPAVA